MEALYNILSAALSKHDKVWQDAGKARQLRSRLIEILNGDPAASPLGGAHRRDAPYSSHRAPQRVRLRFRFACGLADSLFEHRETSHTTAPLSKMPTMYCVKLGIPAARKGVRVAVDKTNDRETSR